MADVEYKKVLKSFINDMSKYSKITKLYKKDKKDLPQITVDEDGNLIDLFHVDISPKVNLIQNNDIILYIWIAGELYELQNVYHIAYTLETDNIHTMFCYSDGKWKSRIIGVDSNYNIIRNDFKYCIENELTLPPLPKKKRRKFKKY